jgi:DNA repair photolyase
MIRMKARQPADSEPIVAAPDPFRRAPGAGAQRGRGATFNPANRFRQEQRESVDDGWGAPAAVADDGDAASSPPKTVVRIQPARTIISRNDSPDIPYTQSINPYQGCEHGCIYCYARPTHAFLDLSPGLDFETKLFAKPNAAALLRAELAKPGYRCDPIALGSNTDPYQPIEREWKITRSVIEVLAECDHPLTITTKGALLERDLDLLAPMAAKGLVRVFISIAMLDGELARKLDPRAAAPHRRLALVKALADAGVPVGVNVAPVIPQLTDFDLEAILEAAAAAGARHAGWTMLRLPLEIAPLFRDWLAAHYPLRAAHVMSIVQQIRGGRDYESGFGVRMGGRGEFADLIRRRFALACKRLDLNTDLAPRLDLSRFRPPILAGSAAQLDLFADGGDRR